MKTFASLIEKYKTAVFEKDLETFASLYSDDIRVFDMWQQWSYDGLSPWKEMARGWFTDLGVNRDRLDFSDLQIDETPEMAVATAIVRFTNVTESGEELRFLENRLTWVAKKKGDAWQIIHQHASGPIDFATMKVKLTKA